MAGDFILSLGLTIIIEGLTAILWGFCRRDLLLLVLVNTLTNPAALLLHFLLPGWGFTVMLESVAVAVEGLCYDRLGLSIRCPWLFSLVANMLSFFLGLGMNKLI